MTIKKIYKNQMLSGIKDLDYKILNNLSDKDLVNFCSVNKQADEYCNDQNFWMNRTLSIFSKIGIDLLKYYKKDRNWSDYYIDLVKIKNIVNEKDNRGYFKTENLENFYYTAVKEGRWDHIIILLSRNLLLRFLMKKMVREDSSKFFENFNFLEKRVNSDIWSFGLESASEIGKLNIVEYLIKNKGKYYLNIQRAIIVASREGHLDIVKYLVEEKLRQLAEIETKYSFFRESFLKDIGDALRYAASSGYLNIVKYLVEKGVDVDFKVV